MKSQQQKHICIACALILAAATFMLSGCSGGGVSAQTGNDGENTLQLTVVPDRLNVTDSGSCTVKVVLWDANGEPLEGTVALSTTLGSLGSSSLSTASNPDGATAGATTTLTANNADTVGNAVVTATFGTIQVWVTVEFYKTL
ncbi:MAG: hypothetical protein HY788_20815 [Deltaproteobacteria bacterium]|nr:hypothetical protein [Deltaproteobacteria bacterium]